MAVQVEAEHDDVGSQALRVRHGFFAAAGGGDDLHARLFAVDQPGQAPQHGLVIVHQQDADGMGFGLHEGLLGLLSCFWGLRWGFRSAPRCRRPGTG
ncbi:hypothetical protein D9M69_538420 [compost metagenome]